MAILQTKYLPIFSAIPHKTHIIPTGVFAIPSLYHRYTKSLQILSGQPAAAGLLRADIL